MLKKYLDDIFKCLYGEIKDEYGERYSSYYKGECANIVGDFDYWLNIMMKNYMPAINTNNIMAMIIYFEQGHIGNDLKIDYKKLHKLAERIIKEICK
jgi:hypothetical protein